MTRPNREDQAQVQQVLDRLNITPQQLLHFHESIISGVASPPRWINTSLQRSSGPGARPLRRWRIDADVLHANLGNVFNPLDAAGIGYCYLIYRRGVRVHERRNGAARIGIPGFSLGGARFEGIPRVDWDFDVPANLASVSKVITAIAMDMLLRDMGIAHKTPIANYLPSYWERHWSTDPITFQDLLCHESGLGWIWNQNGVRNTGNSPGDFIGARAQLRFGSGGRGPGTFDYKNCNYTILRAMFPIVAGVVPRNLPLPGGHDSFWDLTSATFYRDYCNARIFAPANVGPFDFLAAPDAAWAYANPPAEPGARLSDVTTDSGSSGWHMGLRDLMKVIAKFRYGGVMMTSGQVQRLLAARYGIDEIDDTSAGAVYAKRGRFIDGNQNTLDTGIFLMPSGLELGVFINSGPGSGTASFNDGIRQQIINSAVAS